jgi:hypothetical protein
LELTYAAISANGNKACAWLASYPNATTRGLAFNSTNCTTGYEVSEENIALDENGGVIDRQGQPQNINENVFTQTPAPFDFGTCYPGSNSTSFNGSTTLNNFRSYMFFTTLPPQFANLPVYETLDLSVPPPPPAPTIELKFEAPIADECKNVTNGFASPTYLVYWLGNSGRFGACSGNPTFIALGNQKNCFQAGFPDVFDLITTTYLSCNAAKTHGCVWSADYIQYNGQFPTLECVTTGCRNCTLYDGSAIPPAQLAPIPRNNFAISPVDASARPAPFPLATCFAPSNPTTLRRSYQIYCDYSDIPLEWRNLNLQNITRLTPAMEQLIQLNQQK